MRRMSVPDAIINLRDVTIPTTFAKCIKICSRKLHLQCGRKTSSTHTTHTGDVIILCKPSRSGINAIIYYAQSIPQPRGHRSCGLVLAHTTYVECFCFIVFLRKWWLCISFYRLVCITNWKVVHLNALCRHPLRVRLNEPNHYSNRCTRHTPNCLSNEIVKTLSCLNCWIWFTVLFFSVQIIQWFFCTNISLKQRLTSNKSNSNRQSIKTTTTAQLSATRLSSVYLCDAALYTKNQPSVDLCI